MNFVGCDNVGENIKLEKTVTSMDWKLNLELEYMGKATPQRDCLAEVGFSSIERRE